MPSSLYGVHVVTTVRSYKGKTYRSHLLRRSFREGGKVKKETVANLTKLGDEIVEVIRRALRGEKMVPSDELFEKLSSKHHGHVDAVLKVVKKLGLDKLISAKPCRERDIIIAVIVARICKPDSKLAMTRWWGDTTLPDLLDLAGVSEDHIYEAMDWLLKRQKTIEKKLAKRHLSDGDMVLYDLTSSYFEGVTCPLAKMGKSRDRKRNTLQVNYGLVSTKEGCPVSVSVYEGNTADPTTLMEQAQKVRDDFGVSEMVLVGDRGMITQKQIDQLRETGRFDWITAMKTGGIRKLVEGGSIQLDLFDERNLFEFTHPDYPGERLVACRNPSLGRKREYKRESMLEATAKELEKIRRTAGTGKLKTTAAIGVRVGRVLNKYKMAKHIVPHIEENRFDFELNKESIAAEAALDGIYVIRTSLSEEKMDAAEAVRSYKNLTKVERAFKSLKSVDLLVRPIRHRTEDRVRAHIFLSMLTYYVQRNMAEALRPLLFADEDQDAKSTRDPVAPAERSTRALEKARTKILDDGTAIHSFKTLLHHMSTITRDRCVQKIPGAADHAFDIDTMPNPKQREVYRLLDAITCTQ